MFAPVEVEAQTLLVVALLGLVANIAAFALLHGADRKNLNIRGALLHVLGDLLGSVAVLAGGVVILATGWMPIDPLLSMAVGLILARSAWRLIMESGHILLEGAPNGIAVADIKQDPVANVPGLAHVHHVHAWSLTQSQPLITLHAQIEDDRDDKDTIQCIKERLASRFSINNATIEIERLDEGHEA